MTSEGNFILMLKLHSGKNRVNTNIKFMFTLFKLKEFTVQN